jgi:hypothetical protein
MSLHDWQIAEDDAILDLAKHLTDPKYGLAHAVANGGSLTWHHNGERRVFPNDYMVNVLASLRDYAALREGGRITEIPPASYMLQWCDALPEHPEERLDGGDAS